MDSRIFDWLKGMEATDLVPAYTLENLALTLLLSVFLGQVVAWVYMWTHTGVSYTRSFTQSLVLLTIVVSLVMFVIGNSIVTAFGLMGALAIIRFRNVLKDTRDTVYVFFSLVLGMALGSQRHLAALVGTVALLTVALLADCVATEPSTEAEPPTFSAVEDRHKDHIHRLPTPN